MDQFMAMQNFLLLRKVFSYSFVAILAPRTPFSQPLELFLATLFIFQAASGLHQARPQP
jgi:hypothetical protein